MKFELNNYHRNVSDTELINDVIKVAKTLKKDTITQEEYQKYGRFSGSTMRRRFGNWEKTLELANLSTKGHNFKYIFSKMDAIQDIKDVCVKLKKDTLTHKEYDIHGKYHSTTLMRNLGCSWNQILNMAGIKITLNREFTKEEMFEEIERIWMMLGRQPTTTDINKRISKYSLNSYCRRFGGWRQTLQAFVNYINEEQPKKRNNETEILKREKTSENPKCLGHKTNRDINLRLRFKVLLRDHFTCCACGASPAKNPSVKLHVDHKKPWSKGGETVLDNLQTLCEKCNLGKSDIEIE